MENIAITSPFQEPFSPPAATKSEHFPNNGVKVYRSYIFKNLSVGAGSNFLIKIKKAATLPYFFIRIMRIIKKEDPDILHAHATFLCAIPAIILGRLFRKPVVYELRSLWFDNENFKASKLTRIFAAALERYCLNNCQRIITISDGLAEYVTTLPNSKNRSVTTIKNGIDDESINSVEQICTQTGKIRFGYIGSVIDLEGLHFVLQALKLLETQGVSIDFHIYGDGSARESLEKSTNSLGVKVHFHGRFHPDEAQSIYNKLDVIINYRKSGEISEKVTPLKPLEALLHRKTLICSDVGGYREILDGDHAVYIQPDRPDLLADAILEVYLDNNKHQTLINKGFAFVTEKRLWSKNGEKYHELYRGML
ncbi:glycosyltransferase family 4 protein [Pseudomonas sp. TNT19]|uniref:Glycosyltransferase family 4 protein n=1 Tax=Pseudomonas violetae TaxID=2915813 RepID=A0ABT0F6P5_9PSED|nr:glycosyltransferase family 4 protein [Pseudomonas violetae]